MGQARILLKQAAIPETIGQYTQAIRRLKRAERLLDGNDDAQAGKLRAQIYAWSGSMRNFQGRFRDGIDACKRAIEEAESSGDRRALAHAYYLLDWSYVALGSPELATYSEQALAIYEELGELPRQADVLNNMGAWAYLKGRWDEALELYERGRDLRERIGDPAHAANGTLNIAEIYTDQGRLEDAEKLAREALRVWRASRAPASAAFATRQLGRVEARSGRHAEALDLLGQARASFAEAGAQSDANETDGSVAECLVLAGRPKEALDLLGPAIARAEKTGGFELPQLKRVRAYALLQTEGAQRRRPSVRGGPGDRPAARIGLRGSTQPHRPGARARAGKRRCGGARCRAGRDPRPARHRRGAGRAHARGRVVVSLRPRSSGRRSTAPGSAGRGSPSRADRRRHFPGRRR